MFYEDRVFNFQRKDGAKNWWVWGEDRCLNVPIGLEDRISSIRFSGAPDDWKYDTINFYSDPVFTGLDKRKTENEIVDKTCDASGPSYTPTTPSPILVTLTIEPGH